jgi:PGF-pre-PGF domain-containing protein
VDQLQGSDVEDAAQALSASDPEEAAEALAQLSVSKSAALLSSLHASEAARIVERLDTAEATQMVAVADSAKSADILSRMDAGAAIPIIEVLPAQKLSEVISHTDEEVLIDLLSEVSPSKLYEVPLDVLFQSLPNAPTEQLVSEASPLPDPGLPSTQVVEERGDLTRYHVPRTEASTWVTVAGSPEGIERILAKFRRAGSDVRVTVQALPGLPDDVQALPPDTMTGLLYRVSLENVQAGDVAVAHITLEVEKEWLRSNGIHGWSIQVQRFDEDRRAWVSYPTKRLREDEATVAYSSVLPGFSVIAVTGSREPPQRAFDVTELSLDPAARSGGQFAVTAKVTNLTPNPAVYPVSLWIDGRIESVQTVALDGMGTTPIRFTASRPAGTYQVRIDRLVRDIQVEPSAPATTVPMQWLVLGLALSVAAVTAVDLLARSSHRQP